MGHKYINKQLAEAVSGGFTQASTGLTAYSEAIDVSVIDSTKTAIYTVCTYTNRSGANITMTVQSYQHGLNAWVDTAITATIGNASSDAQATRTACTQGAFGTRIRLKMVSSGTYGGSESVVTTAYIVGKE